MLSAYIYMRTAEASKVNIPRTALVVGGLVRELRATHLVCLLEVCEVVILAQGRLERRGDLMLLKLRKVQGLEEGMVLDTLGAICEAAETRERIPREELLDGLAHALRQA